MADIFTTDKKFGFGLMRLPLTDPNDEGSIDIEQTKKMVDTFIENGFTYFDTAYMYCKFKSEKAVKEVLTDRYARDKFTLATKLHASYLKTKEDRDRIFNEQREKCGVEFFDCYLLHNIGRDHYRIFTDLDCFNWLKEKKEAGLIRHMGFSFHDTAETLDMVLNEHPEMEFVQIQLNYLDWDSESIQSAKCLEVCRRHGKPVIVMEPVKGGVLAGGLPVGAKDIFEKLRPDMPIPSWGYRFAASREGVRLVLSGMSSIEQMNENMTFMKDFKPLDAEEENAVKDAVKIISSSIAVPCTGCSYCTPGCPMNIPIPKYFSLYNAEVLEPDTKSWTAQEIFYGRLTDSFGKASDCIACGQCEGICPQHIHIIDKLKEVAARFES